MSYRGINMRVTKTIFYHLFGTILPCVFRYACNSFALFYGFVVKVVPGLVIKSLSIKLLIS